MGKRSPRVSENQLPFDLRVKRCARCKRELAGWDFVQNKRKFRGLDPYCLVCSRIRHREFVARNPEYREKRREYSREYNRRNVELLRRKSAAWYRSNTERRKQRGKAWSDANRERHRELNRGWAKANPEGARALWSRYYARRTTAKTFPFTAQALRERWAYYGDKCWICRRPAEATDHVKPLNKGGAHMLCNLRPICTPCNSAKRDKWPYPEVDNCAAA